MLHNKKVLITGASGGIGASIARTLHAQGANIVLSGTNETRLKELQAELPDSHILVCHLDKKEEVVSLVKKAEDLLEDGIDILVNNAGITKDSLLMRMKDEDWDSVLAVNLTACFLLSRAAITSMIKKRFGRIINISSVVGVMGNPGQSNYCASKAGLIGFSKSLALEVASRGITVNCIAPGFIASHMTDQLNEVAQTRLKELIPMKRIGDPECVADAVLYLANASYVTGQTLHVNGGLTMI